jgi:hypothetical protein
MKPPIGHKKGNLLKWLLILRGSPNYPNIDESLIPLSVLEIKRATCISTVPQTSEDYLKHHNSAANVTRSL